MQQRSPAGLRVQFCRDALISKNSSVDRGNADLICQKHSYLGGPSLEFQSTIQNRQLPFSWSLYTHVAPATINAPQILAASATRDSGEIFWALSGRFIAIYFIRLHPRKAGLEFNQASLPKWPTISWFGLYGSWFIIIHVRHTCIHWHVCLHSRSLRAQETFPHMQLHTAGNKAPSCTPMPVRQPSTPWQWNNVPEPAAWCACWWRWYGLEEATLQSLDSDVSKSRPFDTYGDLCSSTTESVSTSKSVLLYKRFLGHVGETRGRCNRFTNKTATGKSTGLDE